jgi:hypothetical protein
LPLALAIIGGMPNQFAPLIQLISGYCNKAGHAQEQLKVGINTHYISPTIRNKSLPMNFYPTYAAVMTKNRKRKMDATQQPTAIMMHHVLPGEQ